MIMIVVLTMLGYFGKILTILKKGAGGLSQRTIFHPSTCRSVSWNFAWINTWWFYWFCHTLSTVGQFAVLAALTYLGRSQTTLRIQTHNFHLQDPSRITGWSSESFAFAISTHQAHTATWPNHLTYLPVLPTCPTHLQYLLDLPTWHTIEKAQFRNTCDVFLFVCFH